MSENQFYRDTSRKVIIDSLRSGSYYQFKIASINRVGQSKFSPITSEARTEPDVPEEIVQRAECVHVYPRAITLQWIAPNSWGIPIKYYEIKYRGGDYRAFMNSPVIKITSEEANKESNLVKKKMKNQAFIKFEKYQERKKNQQAQAERKKRLKMSDEKLKIYLKKIDAKYKNRALNQTIRKTMEIDHRYTNLMSATVRGLKPGNTYQFIVRAFNNKGCGPYSPVSISTATVSLPPKAMQNIYTSHITPFGCRVSWQKPDCRGTAIVEYCVFYSKIVNRKEYKNFMKNYDSITSSRRGALTIDDMDDSMLDASQVEHINLNQLKSCAIDLMPTVSGCYILSFILILCLFNSVN
jgi:hypothetical protein